MPHLDPLTCALLIESMFEASPLMTLDTPMYTKTQYWPLLLSPDTKVTWATSDAESDVCMAQVLLGEHKSNLSVMKMDIISRVISSLPRFSSPSWQTMTHITTWHTPVIPWAMMTHRIHWPFTILPPAPSSISHCQRHPCSLLKWTSCWCKSHTSFARWCTSLITCSWPDMCNPSAVQHPCDGLWWNFGDRPWLMSSWTSHQFTGQDVGDNGYDPTTEDLQSTWLL